MDIITTFDDLIACYNTVLQSTCEEEFKKFVLSEELLIKEYREVEQECKRLKSALDGANVNISTLERKLNSARNLLDLEKHHRKRIEAERNAFINLFDEIRNYFLHDPRLNIPEETKRRFCSISKSIENLNLDRYDSRDKLGTINEINSTGSNLSDISISHVEMDDDLRDSFVMLRHPMNKKKHANCDEEFLTPKRRKSDTIAFSPTAPRAESVESLESVPPVECRDENDENRNPILDRLNTKMHCFISKQMTISESCMPCNKRIGFQHRALKCTGCKAVVHVECRDRLPLPCLRMTTPNKHGVIGTLQDYAPPDPPLIPAIVVHCVNEIEKRGLSEKGIYRISGTDSETRALKDKFLKGKGIPNLCELDIYVVCDCLKSFLRNLQDSVVPQSERAHFVEALSKEDKQATFRRLISKLPQVNRETLAFLVLHLKRVASSPDCKMTVSNLAKMFGPAIIGYSGKDVVSASLDAEMSNAVMEELLSLPCSVWNGLITECVKELGKTPQRTPSNESLFKKSRAWKYTPRSKQFFGTPAK